MSEATKETEQDQISEELKELVIARLNLIPAGVKLSIGSEGEFSRAELISSVTASNSVGQQVAQRQLEFLQALGEGRLLDELTAD